MININNTLSVCIISKDEELNIERCIKSVKSIANEVIVVDTGSKDKTVEIARYLGATILRYEWNGDFSAARNISIDNASCDWIFFIDCDEELSIDSANELKGIINSEKINSNYEGMFVKLINIVKGKKVAEDKVLRLFKNKTKYRFRGEIHEQIRASIQESVGIESIGKSDIEIFHYGYDLADVNKEKKSNRNFEILLKYPEEKKDGYYYYALGNEYSRNKFYDEAMNCYSESLKLTSKKEVDYNHYSYLAMNIVKMNYFQRKFHDCLATIERFNKELPNFKDMFFIKCMCNIELDRLLEAKSSLEDYLNCPKGNYRYPIDYYESYYNVDKLYEELIKLCEEL